MNLQVQCNRLVFVGNRIIVDMWKLIGKREYMNGVFH